MTYKEAVIYLRGYVDGKGNCYANQEYIDHIKSLLFADLVDIKAVTEDAVMPDKYLHNI